MKKLLVITAFAVLCGISCKKEYTCRCEIANTDPNVNSVNVTEETRYTSITKSKAKRLCVSYVQTKIVDNSSTTTRVDCRLK